jgi:biopolymer transport protein ExbB/TolQ
MWAIAITAAVGLVLFCERLFATIGLARALRDTERRLRETALRGSMSDLVPVCNAAPAGMAAVLMRGIEAAMRRSPREDILAEMTRDGRRLSLHMRRGLGFLATLGTMAPFLGLFGTVLGIMDALRSIGKSGTGGLDVVATGVSEALVATAAGIFVAVVMVLLHQLLRAQMARAVLEVQVLVEDAADQFARAVRHEGPNGQFTPMPGSLPARVPEEAAHGAA